MATRNSPDPKILHRIAYVIEREEGRYQLKAGSSSTNQRGSFPIGRLLNIVKDTEDFFDLVSLRMLMESNYTVAQRAGAARVVLSCVSCWSYTSMFEEPVVARLKEWVLEDDEVLNRNKKDKGRASMSDEELKEREALRTFATGLLAVALGGDEVVDDIVRTGVVGSLMRYLRLRVLGDEGNSRSQPRLSGAGEEKSSMPSSSRSRGVPMEGHSQGDDARPHGRAGRLLSRDITSENVPPMVTIRDRVHDWKDSLDRDRHGEESARGGGMDEEVAVVTKHGDGMLLDDDKWLPDGGTPGKAPGAPSDTEKRRKVDDGSSRVATASGAAGRGSRQAKQARGKPSQPDEQVQLGTGLGEVRVLVGDVDVSQEAWMARNAAEVEARSASAPAEAVQAAGEAAVETVKAAASEALAAGKPTESAKSAAKAAASSVCNASAAARDAKEAMLAERSRGTSGSAGRAGPEAEQASKEEEGDSSTSWQLPPDVLAYLRERFCVLCMAAMGEYLEVLGPVLHERGVDVCLGMLRRPWVLWMSRAKPGGPISEEGVPLGIVALSEDGRLQDDGAALALSDILKMLCTLLAHRKFATLFVDRGGLQLLLGLPRFPGTFVGTSLCLFALASIQGVIERICQLPHPILHDTITLALQLLTCPYDVARKNAALFFGAVFVFPAVIDTFDAQDGIRTLLNLLRAAAVLRSGGGLAAPPPVVEVLADTPGAAAGAGEAAPEPPANGALPRGGEAAAGPAGEPFAPFQARVDRTPEVLTSAGKQIAYHTCVALRQYMRTHFLLLIESLKPATKVGKGAASRSAGSAGRPSYKPVDASNEVVDGAIAQLQRDRKMGQAFVKTRWATLEKFMELGGVEVMLELTQAAPAERYFHEIVQYALGVLQLVTLSPASHRRVIGTGLSNERPGMAVILDVASGPAVFGDPEAIQAALLVLVNLVCPPPSLCSRLPNAGGGNQAAGNSVSGPISLNSDARGNQGAAQPPPAGYPSSSAGPSERERGERREEAGLRLGAIVGPPGTLGVVADRRISLGVGGGGCGMAAYMEQGYRQAREAVRQHNGIKALLHLLHPRTLLLPATLDCTRVLACRVLLGLARDPAIAHILTKLQVGKMLSELLRDGAGQAARTSGTAEEGKWRSEFQKVAVELITIAMNAGRASTAAANEAAAPTLRRIERAAIAAATPITYSPKELLQLVHHHLMACNLHQTAATLLSESNLAPLPSIAGPTAGDHATSLLTPSAHATPFRPSAPPPSFPQPLADTSPATLAPTQPQPNLTYLANLPSRLSTSTLLQDASPGQSSCGQDGKSFLSSLSRTARQYRTAAAARPPTITPRPKLSIAVRARALSPPPSSSTVGPEAPTASTPAPPEAHPLPTAPRSAAAPIPPHPNRPKRKFEDVAELGLVSPPTPSARSGDDTNLVTTPAGPSTGRGLLAASGSADAPFEMQPAITQALPGPSSTYSPLLFASSAQVGAPLGPCGSVGLMGGPTVGGIGGIGPGGEHATLDMIVLQYLKHQHRQCPAPITTLPPLSLLHPHVCPEPRRPLDAPLNIAARVVGARPRRPPAGGPHGRRYDRQFVYSRFRPWRSCRDDAVTLMSVTFLGSTSRIAAGSQSGEIRFFDCWSGEMVETYKAHTPPVYLLQSAPRGPSLGLDPASGTSSGMESQLLLSSTRYEVRLWDTEAMEDPLASFDGVRAGRFNQAATKIVALSGDSNRREVLLYDVASGQLSQTLTMGNTFTSSSATRAVSQHGPRFNQSDTLVLWNGVLWDPRISTPLHKFDQFTNYGGGGFNPNGNDVIINSEVWDLRTYKLLRSVPSLDQTSICFNSTGDVIYAILRRNTDDLHRMLEDDIKMRHPLYSSFRTIDATDYNDIATTLVDSAQPRWATDLAVEESDAYIAVAAIDQKTDSVARIFEVGRRRPADDDSDYDNGSESGDEDSEGDDDMDDDEDEEDVQGDDEDAEVDLNENVSDDDDEGGNGPPVSDGDSDDDDDYRFHSDDEEATGEEILDMFNDGDEEHMQESEFSDGGSSDSDYQGGFNEIFRLRY